MAGAVRSGDLYGSMRTWARVTDVLIDSAVVLAAATAVQFLLGSDEPAPERPCARAAVTRGGPALSISF